MTNVARYVGDSKEPQSAVPFTKVRRRDGHWAGKLGPGRGSRRLLAKAHSRGRRAPEACRPPLADGTNAGKAKVSRGLRGFPARNGVLLDLVPRGRRHVFPRSRGDPAARKATSRNARISRRGGSRPEDRRSRRSPDVTRGPSRSNARGGAPRGVIHFAIPGGRGGAAGGKRRAARGAPAEQRGQGRRPARKVARFRTRLVPGFGADGSELSSDGRVRGRDRARKSRAARGLRARIRWSRAGARPHVRRAPGAERAKDRRSGASWPRAPLSSPRSIPR